MVSAESLASKKLKRKSASLKAMTAAEPSSHDSHDAPSSTSDELADERKPVATLSDLETLDERDIISGYFAGLAGRDEPGIEFNRSYWHGWANGMRDKGRLPPTPESVNLAREFIENERRNRAAAIEQEKLP